MKNNHAFTFLFLLPPVLTAILIGCSRSTDSARDEVPHGYQVLNWADLEPDANKKAERVPVLALELSGKKTRVYVRGYILPGRRVVQLKEFSICRTSDQSRFANTLGYRPTDLIRIELTSDLTIDYTTHEIGIGGIFQADDENSNAPYCIKADYIYP
jgi:hypothetical protein